MVPGVGWSWQTRLDVSEIGSEKSYSQDHYLG